MKKIIILIIAIVVVVLIALGVFYLMQKNAANGTPGTGEQTTLPPVSTSTPAATAAPTSTTLAIGTSQGIVTVNNFYASADFITQDKQTVAIKNDPDYVIAYNVSDSSFAITILSTPLEAVRQAAESTFLAKLGISQQDACKLTVYEGVPASVSSQYVGQSFPLSFCGGPPTL